MTDVDLDDLDRNAVQLERDWCTAVDGHDLDAIQSLFVEGGLFSTRGRRMDAAARAEFFPDLWASSGDRSTHVCRDIVATRDADQVVLTARLAASFIQDDGTVRVVWGHYDDVAVVTPDGLRLVSKTITLERIETFTEDRHGVRPEFDHVGVAVHDLSRMVQLLTGPLGGTLVSGGLEPDTGLRSAHVTFPGGGKIELLEPTKDGPVRDFVTVRGPGVHHLTVLVADVDEAIAKLAAAGFRTVGRNEPTAMWHEAYVHPRDASGCLIQLVRAGAGYGVPVPVELDQILQDGWTWVDRKPVRVPN